MISNQNKCPSNDQTSTTDVKRTNRQSKKHL
jgi:hypothetical protein